MSGHAAFGVKQRKEQMPVKVTSDLSDRTREIVDAINRRAYEIFEARGYLNGRDLDDWLQAESELLYPLHLDVQELDNTLILRCELLGFGSDEFEVKVEPRMLTIAGERRQSKSSEAKGTAMVLQSAPRILRTVELPEQVLTEKATARLREGILEVTLPKAPKGPELISSAA